MDEQHAKGIVGIDVFVDGSWLNAGRLNPKEAGGWGGVIVARRDSGEPQWFSISSNVPESVTSNLEAEYYGLLQATHYAISMRQQIMDRGFPDVPITLHTDQLRLVRAFSSDSEETSIRLFQNPLIRDLKELVRDINVSVKFAADRKSSSYRVKDSHPLMGIANALAGQAAWLARLEKQNGQAYLGDRILRNPEAQRTIRSWRVTAKDTEEAIQRGR